MKKKITLLILLTILLTPFTLAADDTDIFSECSSEVKPNVLFIFDTSLSMRKQDVIDDSIKEYDHNITDWGEGEFKHDANGNPTTERKEWARPDKFPYKDDFRMLLYKNKIDVWKRMLRTKPFRYLEYDDISCPTAKTALHDKGRYGPGSEGFDEAGPLSYSSSPPYCDSTPLKSIKNRVVVTKNYRNYLYYIENKMKEISYSTGCQGPDDDIKDLECYNSNRDYYNFYGQGLGYGDYPEKDRVYVKLGVTRPFIPLFHKGGIKVDQIECSEVKNDLIANGWSKRRIWEALNGGCDTLFGFIEPPHYLLKTANFLNYLDMKNSRRYNGINAVWRVVKEKYADARFGLMQFDLGQYWHTGKATFWESQGGDLSVPCGASLAHLSKFKQALFGHYKRPGRNEPVPELGQPLYFGWEGYLFKDKSKQTPLAEALVEAGLYFSGQQSWYNEYEFPDDFFGKRFNYNDTIPISDGDDSHVITNAGGQNPYASPIQCPDQQNHVIFITDGAPWDDFSDMKLSDIFSSSTWFTQGSCEWIKKRNFISYNSDGSTTNITIGDRVDYETDYTCKELPSKQLWIDDVAGFLNNYNADDNHPPVDLSPLDGRQTLTTHILSFRLEKIDYDPEPLLRKTAEVGGHGIYNKSETQDELVRQINSLLEGVIVKSTFSSAVTPVRQDDLIYSGDETFLTSFRIDAKSRGNGNIKRYKREAKIIQGQDAADLFDSNGNINTNAIDLWGISPTGSDAASPTEGVAYKLWKRLDNINDDAFKAKSDADRLSEVASNRKIYSYVAPETDEIAKLALNKKITINDVLGNPMALDDVTTLLLNGVYGIGFDWPLGDIVHSDLAIAKYPGNDILLFAGANDGMLHCFNGNKDDDSESGQEIWAFVPPEFAETKLYNLNTSVHQWYVDGYIEIFNQMNSNGRPHPKYLIFGERRGGNRYYILDISDKTKPCCKNVISGNDWGLSWCRPRLCKAIENGSGEFGFILAGGYDKRYDPPKNSTTPDIPWFADAADKAKGNFISIRNLDDSLPGGEILTMGKTLINNSVVSARIIDRDHDMERIFSRLYAGDLGGNVYHFADDLNLNGEGEENGTKINPTGKWIKRHHLFEGRFFDNVPVPAPTFDDPDRTIPATIYQKIFYPPVPGQSCNGDMVFFGTGDRERPNAIYQDDSGLKFKDSIYAVADDWKRENPVKSDDLNKITLEHPGNEEGSVYEYFPVTKGGELKVSGWYFDLYYPGEKLVSDLIVLGDVLIFGTYTPPPTAPPDEVRSGLCEATDCDPGPGRIYIVNTCYDSFGAKAINTGTKDPMPQPAIVFDKATGKVLINTGVGKLHDSGVSVLSGSFWRHNTDD